MYSTGMRRTLQRHPSSICVAVDRIEVQAARCGLHHLALHYLLSGNMDALRFAPASTLKRGDKLWLSSCFEAFITAFPSKAYLECNFAPSLKWAAYRFDGYRSNMRALGEFESPHIEASLDQANYQMQVSLDLDGLPDLPADAVWHVGLSAVIEDESGRLSYWALAHPPGKADFHHADCFALKLPPKEQT